MVVVVVVGVRRTPPAEGIELRDRERERIQTGQIKRILADIYPILLVVCLTTNRQQGKFSLQTSLLQTSAILILAMKRWDTEEERPHVLRKCMKKWLFQVEG